MTSKTNKTSDPSGPANTIVPENRPLRAGELAGDKGADQRSGDEVNPKRPDEIEIKRGDTDEPGKGGDFDDPDRGGDIDRPGESPDEMPPDIIKLPPD